MAHYLVSGFAPVVDPDVADQWHMAGAEAAPLGLLGNAGRMQCAVLPTGNDDCFDMKKCA